MTGDDYENEAFEHTNVDSADDQEVRESNSINILQTYNDIKEALRLMYTECVLSSCTIDKFRILIQEGTARGSSWKPRHNRFLIGHSNALNDIYLRNLQGVVDFNTWLEFAHQNSDNCGCFQLNIDEHLEDSTKRRRLV